MITAETLLDVLRAAIDGKIHPSLINTEKTWDKVYAGDCAFVFGDWKIIFFNDCGELDYMDCAENLATHEKWNFAETPSDGRDPVEMLTEDERLCLETILAETR